MFVWNRNYQIKDQVNQHAFYCDTKTITTSDYNFSGAFLIIETKIHLSFYNTRQQRMRKWILTMIFVSFNR